MSDKIWDLPYKPDSKYTKKAAYFSMEFGIDQALKIYSGGLGFLAGSHMKSAYDKKQNMIGVGILWKYGYYDQELNEDYNMESRFRSKYYTFLKDTGIIVPVYINAHRVYVKALYLDPEIFGTVPMYFLTTDIDENDYLGRTITHKLYDSSLEARVSQSIVLGIGGGKVVDALGGADIYHLNEGHGIPLAFYLHNKFGSKEEAKKHLVFTTHTPEKAGNSEHDFSLLDKMGFFDNIPINKVRDMIQMDGPLFSYTLAALRLSKVANAVSQLHGEVSNEMWKENEGICKIDAITNAQNSRAWQDEQIKVAFDLGDDEGLVERKKIMKKELFDEVADQTGKLFDPDVLTIVWGRRFAEYKRADLMLHDMNRFIKLLAKKDHQVQFIWAGKPYPEDYNAISVFNHLVNFSYKKPNVAVLTGYEIALSHKLKKGSDIWLNTPRRPREASGTSGMTAAMNGSVNVSINDGWICEFAKHKKNAFIIPEADTSKPLEVQDTEDYNHLMSILEDEVVPLYYDKPKLWLDIVKNSMKDVMPFFESGRMAEEYYNKIYNF